LDRVRVVITTPLEDELVRAIGGADPRLDVVYERDLLAAPSYPSEHPLPPADSPRELEKWRELLAGAEVMFDFGPHELVQELAALQRLRWIQATSAGVGPFVKGVGLAENPKIVVTTASGVHARPLAEFVLMAVLIFGKDALRLAADQRAHRWERYAGEEIAGKRVGVIGLGRIGREVARVLRGLDARTVGAVRTLGGRSPADLFVEAVVPYERIDEILPELDFLVLSCPHTPQTHRLLDRRRLALLPPRAVVINIARGDVVEEAALVEALANGRLRGAALDVFEQEPLPADSPLWDMANVLVSPHSASTVASENERIVALFVKNLTRYLAGEPLVNLLDNERLY
jgi:glyoxylate/hydroxypyruvate reductase A